MKALLWFVVAIAASFFAGLTSGQEGWGWLIVCTAIACMAAGHIAYLLTPSRALISWEELEEDPSEEAHLPFTWCCDECNDFEIESTNNVLLQNVKDQHILTHILGR